MSELVYSIKQIFGVDKGALADCKALQYYIAPYQRGYKWASFSSNDQVPQMLTDIFEAYKNDSVEYFLQYITVKQISHNGKNVLEIIDGQQRLTTLSIFFYVINHLDYKYENIAKDKLLYYRYEDLSENVFDALIQKVKNKLEENDGKIERQDEYYMIKAARTIIKFLDLLKSEDKIDDYYNYLLNKVKIIFNLEDENTKSEEIFENLNGNKVELTNMYLIKGLLLTNAVIRNSSTERALSYKEILDQRTIMGRMWDEIVSWISQEDIAHFFFAQKRHEKPDGMECLLKLVIQKYKDRVFNTESLIQKYYSDFHENQANDEQQLKYELFNRYNCLVNGGVSAAALLNEIKHTYRALLNIWSDAELYNILGYVRFASISDKPKTNINTDPEYWVYNLVNNGNQARVELAKRALEILPNMEDPKIKQDDYYCLRYSTKNVNLTRLLLSFSVFPENMTDTFKFGFYRYDDENWTFEHLSPQNPKKSIKIPPELSHWVVERINETGGGNESEEGEGYGIGPELKALIQDVELGNEVDTDKLDFLFDSNIDEDYVGNMALLDGGSNSAVSNNPFVIKRSRIIDKINQNKFVPIHTISVYEKALNTMGLGKTLNPDLFCWGECDSKAHKDWMVRRNKEIRNYLEKYCEQ